MAIFKILAANKAGERPIYRRKVWEAAARRLEKRRKKKNWLNPFWKSSIFVPPTPGSKLKKLIQVKEEQLRAGGRESWPIEIIEMAGKTLEQTLVKTDPFNGNNCIDKKCISSQGDGNQIN